MNLNEALELHKAVSAFHDDTPQKRPQLSIFDMQNRQEGYILCVRRSGTSRDFLGFLVSLAQARDLSIREFRGCLVLYSLRAI